MEDEYGRVPWLHEAAITDPTGLKVTVTVTVPVDADWDHSEECSEYAQMAAIRAIKQITKNRKDHYDKVPF